MIFLTGALLIGPLRRAAGESAPANIYIRRDLGIWSALLAIVHFVAGNVVAMDQGYLDRFVRMADLPLGESIRHDVFVWGAITGTVSVLVFVFLWLISSDWVLRRLRVERWKKLQKGAHFALWITVFHGLLYQWLEQRYVPLLLLAALTLVIFVLQFRGRRRAAV